MAVIGLSGNSDPSLIPRLLKNGANDFLRNPFSREEFFCRVSQSVHQLELIGTLQDLATHDFLTGRPNRRNFLEQGQRPLPQWLARNDTVSVAMLDIVHFKHINDRGDHQAGDDAQWRRRWPRMRARRIWWRASAARNSASWCRALDAHAASAYFETLRRRIDALKVQVGEQTLRITISIGVCSSHTRRDALHPRLADADKHLYLAKAGGRNRVAHAA